MSNRHKFVGHRDLRVIDLRPAAEAKMSSHPSLRLTPEEYLALERKSEYKSEYFNGEMLAMTGASEPHNLIAGNVFASLHFQLRKRQCKV